MSEKDDPDLIKAALALTQSIGSVVGLDLSALNMQYGRRTPEHIAEVARLARENEAMNAGIDRFAESRANGYDDKSTEVAVDTRDVLQTMIAVSPVTAKQNQEETDERS
jgi:hypothetical protein